MAAEILNFTDTATVKWTKGAQTGTDPVYGLPIFPLTAAVVATGKKELSSAVPLQPLASQNVLIYTAPSALTLPGNFASPNAYGSVGTNPTATATYTVKKNGSSIGTITISTAGVFTFATTSGAPITLAAGDRFTVTAPSSVDPTLADVSFTLVGTF